MASINSVFLVDDDRTSNLINTEILRIFDKNIHISAYGNAQQALDELARLSVGDIEKIPSVIFLDINMPIIDGWEFLEAFKKFSEAVQRKCKVYILTSSIDPDDIEKTKSFKMVQGFISKPLTITHLRFITDEKKSSTQYLSHLRFFYPTNSESEIS
jgi:CheY-like chemotaxis protein